MRHLIAYMDFLVFVTRRRFVLRDKFRALRNENEVQESTEEKIRNFSTRHKKAVAAECTSPKLDFSILLPIRAPEENSRAP